LCDARLDILNPAAIDGLVMAGMCLAFDERGPLLLIGLCPAAIQAEEVVDDFVGVFWF
jgi:hypothetical protein